MTRIGWAAKTAYRRLSNRTADLLGWLAGYCMATCWQPRAATYSPGYSHWRCVLKRSEHEHGWHRTGQWRWLEGQAPRWDPVPFNDLRVGVMPGFPPQWLRGRHYAVVPRAHVKAIARAAAHRKVTNEAAAARLPRVRDEYGELGKLPFTAPLSDPPPNGWLKRQRLDNPDHHEWHIRPPRKDDPA